MMHNDLAVPLPIKDLRVPMLDVHVLLTDEVPDSWAMQCMESIVVAMDYSPFKVELHFEEAIAGDIWQARANGYKEGTAPYVTYVDLDDWLEQNAFAICAPSIAANVPSFMTGALRVDLSNRNVRTKSVRGMQVIKRDLLSVIDKTSGQHCPTCAITNLTSPIQIPAYVLNRRVGYPSMSTRLNPMSKRSA